MKAVYIKEFGGVENLEAREISDPPKPVGSQVLVRVRAAGLNRADLLQRKGFYPAPAGYSSHIPGLEFAGEIAETGDSVSGFKINDRVMGITAGEAQAEYILADASVLAAIPESLNFNEAGAIPEAFITAHDAIITQCDLRGGESILIHAAGSGVGLAAIQLAKAVGAVTIGTSRTADKLSRCAEFGLDHSIVASDGKFAQKVLEITDGKGVNVILDLVGASYFDENLASLASKGRLILVGLTGGRKAEFDMGIALYKRLKIMGTVLRGRTIQEKAEATRFFADFALPLFENGSLRPNLDRVFKIDEIAKAHEYLESNESFGKVVLEI